MCIKLTKNSFKYIQKKAIDTRWINVWSISSSQLTYDFITLTQLWPIVVFPTNIVTQIKMSQVDIGPTLGQVVYSTPTDQPLPDVVPMLACLL